MKYLDEFRDPNRCQRLLSEIRQAATQPWTIMEVCGGQTHGLLRHGIDQQLNGCIQLVHGPGCPICVTSLESIDLAIELAQRPEVVVASFGDMLRVPGSRQSLLQVRSGGGNVRVVYSPLDAVQLARQDPQRHVVFFAVGFETTVPATALAVRQAEHWDLDNFSLLVAHVRVQPAMEQLVQSADNQVQGFLAAGHVCTVVGFQSYQQFVRQYQLPVVVTGFEPVDLLVGIRQCVRQLERGQPRVVNCYSRNASAAGNPRAIQLIDEVYEICDRPWRGLGVVARGGLQPRPQFGRFDVRRRFPAGTQAAVESPDCRSGQVLTGRIKPNQCELFGNRCTPQTPLGAPMVSAEGACAAYFRYPATGRSCDPQ